MPDQAEEAVQAERRRRIRAARMLAVPTPDEVAARKKRKDKKGDLGHRGISQKELGARLAAAEERLGAELISKLERGGREVASPHMKRIAEACGLPYLFFSLDFAALDRLIQQPSSTAPEPGGSLRQRLLGESPSREGPDEKGGETDQQQHPSGDA